MANKNLLTASQAEAERMLLDARMKRVAEANAIERAKIEHRALARKVKADSDRHFKILRALLKSGEKDSFFEGFNGDGGKWDDDILLHPENWIWCRAKYGAIGIPYPDGSEYCFAPGVAFPLHIDFKEYVHNSMSGEVREVTI